MTASGGMADVALGVIVSEGADSVAANENVIAAMASAPAAEPSTSSDPSGTLGGPGVGGAGVVAGGAGTGPAWGGRTVAGLPVRALYHHADFVTVPAPAGVGVVSIDAPSASSAKPSSASRRRISDPP
jgi:hypothetical protein